MNRRSFFQQLAMIGSAVSASPYLFIPKFEPVVWRRAPVQLDPIYKPKFKYFILGPTGRPTRELGLAEPWKSVRHPMRIAWNRVIDPEIFERSRLLDDSSPRIY
jgi:hypothetical protein